MTANAIKEILRLLDGSVVISQGAVKINDHEKLRESCASSGRDISA